MIWKYLVKNKEIVESHITWRLHSGTCSFCWDDWLGIGPLANQTSDTYTLNNTTVNHFLVDGQWNEAMLRQHAPALLIPQILQIKVHYLPGTPDEAIWRLTESGRFSMASARENVQKKRDKNNVDAYLWG